MEWYAVISCSDLESVEMLVDKLLDNGYNANVFQGYNCDKFGPSSRKKRMPIYKIETWPAWAIRDDESSFHDMYTKILLENSLELSGEYAVVHCDYDIADVGPFKK